MNPSEEKDVAGSGRQPELTPGSVSGRCRVVRVLVALGVVACLAWYGIAKRGASTPGSREDGEASGPVAGRAWTVPELGMEFVHIAPGSFEMGSSNGDADEKPVHTVAISREFWLGKYEVTQAEYEKLTGGNPSRFEGARNPVETVPWQAAADFCRKLTESERGAGRLPAGYEYRLPSEAEWEYACRAGTGAAYCFGDDAGRLQEYADHAGNNDSGTAEAGQRLPNAYGLFDMHGNVWEWCADLFRERMTADGDTRNPAEQRRSVRGGNWHDPPENCRSANRCRLLPGSHGNLLGFRVVRSLPELTQAQNADGRRVRGEAAERPVGQGL